MYYDPYEECPERQVTGNMVKPVSVEDDLKPVGQNLEVINVGLKIADSIQHLVNPQPDITVDEVDVLKCSLKQMNHVFHLEDFKGTHNALSKTADTPHTVPRHPVLSCSSMVMTQNTAYMPPGDYGNLAQLKKQKEDEIEDEDEFHDAYMDLEPELISLKQESSMVRKGLMPIPMPRNLKTVTTQQVNDASVYEEPWDLIHKRLHLEKCFEAVAHIDQHQPALMNESVALGGKGEHMFKLDSCVTVKSDTETLVSTNELQNRKNLSGFLLSETSRSWEHFQQAIDGMNTPHSKLCAGIRTDHDNYKPPGNILEQQSDNRGQEGYENPWDLKPHLKDKRPAAEYEMPWDKNVRGLQLLDSILVSDNPAMHVLSKNEGSCKTELDFRPAADYDQPWDKMKQFNSKTAVVLPLQACDSNNWSAGQLADKIDPKVPLELQGWYHGAISRVEAESLLRVYPEGSFLVRTSESNRLDFSLSVKSTSGFMHMKIVNQDSRYILGQFSQPFYTIPQMIHHYTIHKLPIKGAEHMSLLFPIGNEFL